MIAKKPSADTVKSYLLFVGRTRRMTQYAATAVADIDPDALVAYARVLGS